MGIGVWVRADYSAAADLFIGSNMYGVYSNACEKRIQVQGIGELKIEGGFPFTIHVFSGNQSLLSAKHIQAGFRGQAGQGHVEAGGQVHSQ